MNLVRFIIIMMLLMATQFIACRNESLAGGEDFPNSVTADLDTLGVYIIQAVQDTSEWGSVESADLTIKAADEEPEVLAKKALGDFGDSMVWDTSVLASSRLLLYYWENRVRYEKRDTLVFKSANLEPDTSLLNRRLAEIKGVKKFRIGDSEQKYHYRDCDGDGYLRYYRSIKDVICITMINHKGLFKDTLIAEADAGADGFFETEVDNRYYLWDHVQQKPGGEYSRTQIWNADKDSVTLHKDTAISDTVEVHVYRQRPLSVLTQKYTAVFQGNDIIRILQWQEKDSLFTGRVRQSEILPSREGVLNWDTILIKESRSGFGALNKIENAEYKMISEGKWSNTKLWKIASVKKTVVWSGRRAGTLYWQLIPDQPFTRTSKAGGGALQFNWKSSRGDSLIFSGLYQADGSISGAADYQGKIRSVKIKP